MAIFFFAYVGYLMLKWLSGGSSRSGNAVLIEKQSTGAIPEPQRFGSAFAWDMPRRALSGD
jgi:hypothetical protein